MKLGYWDMGPLKLGYLGYRDPLPYTPLYFHCGFACSPCAKIAKMVLQTWPKGSVLFFHEWTHRVVFSCTVCCCGQVPRNRQNYQNPVDTNQSLPTGVLVKEATKVRRWRGLQVRVSDSCARDSGSKAAWFPWIILFIAGTVPNVYSSFLWPKTPLMMLTDLFLKFPTGMYFNTCIFWSRESRLASYACQVPLK